MCGLVGIAGNITPACENLFKLMLQLDVIRGVHSTGIAGVYSNKKEVLVSKKPWLPQDLLEHRETKAIFTKKLDILIGHNRQASMGEINQANAHPFENDVLVGAHNGSIQKYSIPDAYAYGTDSEALFADMAKGNVAKTLRGIDGAAALTWFNKETKKLHIIRNDERPLCYAWVKDQPTLIWASEAWMIMVAALKANVKITDTVDVKPNVLYSFYDDLGKSQFTEEAMQVGATKKFKENGGKADTRTKLPVTHIQRQVPFDKDIAIGDLVFFKPEQSTIQGNLTVISGQVMGATYDCKIYVQDSILAAKLFDAEYIATEVLGYVSSTGNNPPYITGHGSSAEPFDGSYEALVKEFFPEYEKKEESSDAKDGFKKDSGENDSKKTQSSNVNTDEDYDEDCDCYFSGGRTIYKADFNDPTKTTCKCSYCGCNVHFEEMPLYIGMEQNKMKFLCSECELDNILEKYNIGKY